jgi:ABC-2 type transport system ATP-binding protein
MNTIISIKDLYKSYEDIEAVKGISFDIAEGEMFGLVGPDGAGKTTTIRILCGLIKPDSGSVTMIGNDILSNKKEIQYQIGYLSQKFSLYGDLSIDENIEFFADIHGVKDYKKRRNELLEFTRLKSFRERTAEKLSGGMKQKLALACSLIHKPKIIFLDEPTTGVDPVSRRDFWKILSSLLREKITIMLTTPYLDEAERCSRVAMMNNGEIISLDKPKNMKSELGKEIVEIVCDRVREAYRLIRDKLNLEVQLFGDRITVFVDSYQKDFPAVKNLLIENSIEISQARVISASLENIFIYLVRKAG